ncbi:hypothetical protein NC652_025385 [Populus alba x Populus x berolinensis]|nr:hypothetical protein NC652_025385 [Populus alba x Populus x berolinensis]
METGESGFFFFNFFSGSICAGSISWPSFTTNASWQGFVIAKSIRGRKYNLPKANFIILPAPNYFHVPGFKIKTSGSARDYRGSPRAILELATNRIFHLPGFH